jgi:hypothetical protein
MNFVKGYKEVLYPLNLLSNSDFSINNGDYKAYGTAITSDTYFANDWKVEFSSGITSPKCHNYDGTVSFSGSGGGSDTIKLRNVRSLDLISLGTHTLTAKILANSGSVRLSSYITVSGTIGSQDYIKAGSSEANKTDTCLRVLTNASGYVEITIGLTSTGNFDFTLSGVGVFQGALLNPPDHIKSMDCYGLHNLDKRIHAETVYVGTGEKFTTINSALKYLSTKYPMYKSGGIIATIILRSGFIMKEQVIVNGVDLGWITIESEDATVTVDKTYITTALFDIPPTFGAIQNATLPTIGALFKYATKEVTAHDGIHIRANSRITILPNCGFVNSGRHALRVVQSCSALAISANLSDAGSYGLAATDNSYVSAEVSNLSGAGNTGAYASRGSCIDINAANIKNCIYGAISAKGSIINASGADATGCSSGYTVVDCAIIFRKSATGTNNITPNTFSAGSGIIIQ